MDIPQDKGVQTDVQIVRVKSKKRKQKRDLWLKAHWMPVTALAAFIVGLAILLWPINADYNWIKLILVPPLLTASAVLIAIYSRNRYQSNMNHWESGGCPRCGNLDIKRLRRKRSHHLAGRLTSIPFRRYICSECLWRGTRVDEARLH